ncbi:MAG: protein kinase, partial [Thermoanaerobaculia bacterium]|nr:protein kinase [Thermoanaerobaculia bacterium]
MGEVYEARDPELDRIVAIKVLPSDLADDPERVQRFEREARAVGRLNHPNLLAVYDVGRHAGTPYLVCELLEGETLAERLRQGPLAYRQAIDYAIQAAAGLAAAHHAGVVHRDLKPANLFVTSDGRVKILDFGLAKLVEPSEGQPDDSPTLTAATGQGAILGTVGYMSPEQAEGRAVDHRTDQFALGAVLYEMLTGQRPFTGDTSLEVLTAILRDEPKPLASSVPGTPAPLRWIVERCLSKDPAQRYESTRDLERELATVGERSSELSSDIEAPNTPPAGRLHPSRLVLALLLAVAGLIAAFSIGRRTVEPPELSFEQITFRRGTVGAARFDPDGESVVYSAAWEGEPERLYLKRSGSLDPLPVGPAGSRLLSVSDDGELLFLTERRALGPFLEAGTLARMSVAGAPRRVDDDVSDAVWTSDGRLLALVRERSGEAVLEYPPGEVRHSTPGMFWHLDASPDGERIAFVDVSARGHNQGVITVLERHGERTVLTRSGWEQGLAWSPRGDEIWFARGTTLVAVDMDGRERELAHLPQRIDLYDVSPDGRLLLAVERRRWEAAGQAPDSDSEQDLSWLGWTLPFDLSSGDATILFNECGTGTCKACLGSFAEEPPIVLGPGFGLALSPDGEWVISAPPGTPPVLELIATRSDQRRSLAVDGLERIDTARWSPDGEAILLNTNAPGERNRIYRLDLQGGAPQPLTPAGVRWGFFAVSPDGGRLAVGRAEGGIAIYDIASGEETARLSNAEGPIRFSLDGRALFTAPLVAFPSQIHRTDIDTGAKELVASLRPTDPAGVVKISPVTITPTGHAYAYGYVRALSELLVVEGVE